MYTQGFHYQNTSEALQFSPIKQNSTSYPHFAGKKTGRELTCDLLKVREEIYAKV